jgi:hypothetical protein
MQSLLIDRSWAAGIGCAGRKSVEPLSWDAVAERTMCVYQGLLRKPN